MRVAMVLGLSLVLVAGTTANAQYSMSAGDVVSENFDIMGTTGTVTPGDPLFPILPGIKVQTNADVSASLIAVEHVTPSWGGVYAGYNASAAATESDRALTIYKSAVGDTAYIQLTVTALNDIPDLIVSYDLENPWVRASGREGSLALKLNGSTIRTDTVLADATDPVTTWLTDAEMDAQGLAIRGISESLGAVAAGSTVTIQWNGVTSASNDRNMNVGIDNLVLTAVPEPASLALLGLGGLALIRRRR